MKKLILPLIAFSLILIPWVAHSEQARTIDELVAWYDSQRCGGCHYDIHENWSKSWHAKSIVDPRVLRTWRTFILSGLGRSPEARKKDLKDMCLPCHAPMTRDASEELIVHIADLIVTAVDDKDPVKRESAIKELSKINIDCLACHNLKGAPDGNPKPNTIYGPESEASPPHKEAFGFDTVKTGFFRESRFCATCHHGCPPELPSSVCPTLWTSYEEEYLAHGGDKTCQDCHMQGEGGKRHRFPGIYEPDFAGTGIDLKIDVKPTEYVYHLDNKIVPAVVVKVDAKNTSGHGIPHG